MKQPAFADKKHTRTYGFTLIELIVVIAIIGILAAVLLPRLSGFLEKSRKGVCESSRAETVHAFEAYHFMHEDDPAMTLGKLVEGAYPELVTTEMLDNMCPSGGTFSASPKGTYIRCSEHDSDPLLEELDKASGALLNGGEPWKNAVKNLIGDSDRSTFHFTAVTEEKWSSVEEKMKKVAEENKAIYTSTSVKAGDLTWKPAVTTDGKVIMIASDKTGRNGKSDASAITNAYLANQSAAYWSNAYMVFDGENYYAHLNKQNNNYRLDENAVGDKNIDPVKSFTEANGWYKVP